MAKFTKEDYLEWYEQMLLMRKFETKTGQLYIQRKFGGFCHLYNGQEAVLAGSTSALLPEDKMITSYRSHVHPIARGVHPKYVMAELYGKTTGLSKGKGGSMHMFSKEHHVYGGHGIVGGQIPLGAGLAFADKYLDRKNVTITYFGDGAARQGTLHETFNMAMLWKLPVIFAIENNRYSMGTSVARTSNITDLTKLGLGYDMPAFSVDGMDVEAVHTAVSKAAEWARKGKGPTLLVFETYRFKGHSMSDPRKYRTKEEELRYQKEDPIDKVLKIIQDNKYASQKQLAGIEAKINALIQEAIKFAEDSPLPTAADSYKDVYDQEDYPFIIE